MKATARLHELGQSLWLDDITRDLLDRGTLQRYITELSVTGLTSNPTIFDHAITHSAKYDDDIRRLTKSGSSGEALFFELALADLARAAELFLPIHRRTCGVDGWVSLEVSPLLAHDTAATVEAASRLHKAAGKPNLFIKIPGTIEGLPAIEDAIIAGIPINVTLLFSRADYLAAADAYMTGLERRVASGLSHGMLTSVASIFISRWDRADGGEGSRAVARPAWRCGRSADLQGVSRSAGFRPLAALSVCGARPQRLLFASTQHEGPEGAGYAVCHGAGRRPTPINTMPEATCRAFGEHGQNGQQEYRRATAATANR